MNKHIEQFKLKLEYVVDDDDGLGAKLCIHTYIKGGSIFSQLYYGSLIATRNLTPMEY